MPLKTQYGSFGDYIRRFLGVTGATQGAMVDEMIVPVFDIARQNDNPYNTFGRHGVRGATAAALAANNSWVFIAPRAGALLQILGISITNFGAANLDFQIRAITPGQLIGGNFAAPTFVDGLDFTLPETPYTTNWPKLGARIGTTTSATAAIGEFVDTGRLTPTGPATWWIPMFAPLTISKQSVGGDGTIVATGTPGLAVVNVTQNQAISAAFWFREFPQTRPIP